MKKIVSFILSIVMAFTVIVASPLTINVNAANDYTGNAVKKAKNPTISSNLKAGDKFYAGIDLKTGKLNGLLADDGSDLDLPMYICTIKEDNTLKIEFYFFSPIEFVGAAAFLNPETLEAGKELIIPSKINGFTVTELASAWSGFGNTGVKKIVIPETVKKIDDEAFLNNFFVEEIVFDGKSQLKEIGYGAFRDCRSLKSIVIPASVETIGNYAFYNTDMSVDEKARKKDSSYVDGHLGGNFLNCYEHILDAVDVVYDENDNLKSYKINKPELIFDDVYSLTSVKFEEGSKVKNIGYAAFGFQKALREIYLPDHLESLSYMAFWGNGGNNAIVAVAISSGVDIVDLPEGLDKNTISENVNIKDETSTDKKTETKTDKKTETKPVSKNYSINSAPVVMSVTSENAGTIELSWNDVGASGYIVYIAAEGAGNYTKCGTFTDTSATINTLGKNAKLESGKTYFVRVIRSDYVGELWETLGKYAPVSVTVK